MICDKWKSVVLAASGAGLWKGASDGRERGREAFQRCRGQEPGRPGWEHLDTRQRRRAPVGSKGGGDPGGVCVGPCEGQAQGTGAGMLGGAEIGVRVRTNPSHGKHSVRLHLWAEVGVKASLERSRKQGTCQEPPGPRGLPRRPADPVMIPLQASSSCTFKINPSRFLFRHVAVFLPIL